MNSIGYTVAIWAAGALVLGFVLAFAGTPVWAAAGIAAGFLAIGVVSTILRNRAGHKPGRSA